MSRTLRLLATLLLLVTSARVLAADPIPPLLSADYEEVERIMQSVQDLYKRDVITDEQLLAAFRPFYTLDRSQAEHLDRWVERYPKSYVAHLARGIYYKQLGFRHPRDNSQDTKRRAKKRAHDRAARDLYDSIELDEKPLLSYFHAMDLAGWIGRRQIKQLLRAANKVDPDNFIVRHEFLLALRPIVGGSMEEMRAYVADMKSTLSPDQFRRFEATVMLEEARRTLRGSENPAQAERLYRKVLELDPENASANWYLLYALVKLDKCSEVIAVATKWLANPDGREPEVLTKRGWCYMQQEQIAAGVADYQRAAELGDVWAQKEVSGLYWFGKHVPKDVELARHWMQKAAEQGDESAQREMQRSFGVTITSPSVPETFPRWLKTVLFIAAGLAALVFIVWLDHRDSVTAAENRRLMRYPPSVLCVGIAGGAGFGYAAWVGFWSAYLPWSRQGFWVPALFALLALYLIVQWLTVRHELLPDGALFRRFGGRKVPLKWADLQSIRYVPLMRWFRLESKSGDVVRISDMMTGLQPFARAVLMHAEHAIADDSSRERLEAMAEDWAALDEAVQEP